MMTNWMRFAIEELRHVRGVRDAGNLMLKYPFFIKRITGTTGRCRDYPLALQIEPTNICNVACICCSRKSLTREIGCMEFRLFRKIIDDAAMNRVRMVYLYLHGEPFLHPEIMEMIAYIKSKRLAVVITTNGMLLDRDAARRILGCGLTNADHLIFSVLGNTKKTHERIMSGVSHEQVVGNIAGILAARKSMGMNGPIIEAAIYRMPENAHEIEEFVSRWRGVVDHVREPATISWQFAQGGKCRQRSAACKNLHERLTILWNGDVSLCHADLNGWHQLGNMGTMGIREVWNGNALLHFRQMHRERNFAEMPICASCDWT